MNVLINGMPACAVGSMGYFAHVPQGVPVLPPNCPSYWKRYLSNIPMALGLMALTILANIAIAGIASLLPKPPAAEGFIKDVTGNRHVEQGGRVGDDQGKLQRVHEVANVGEAPNPPLPYPGAQGSTAVGSPNVTVNGGPLAFCAPLMGTSCSDIPIVPNAVILGFSNVLVGVSISAMLAEWR
jgi:uncharacterized Zn-binding protein involved in type VI secretion